MLVVDSEQMRESDILQPKIFTIFARVNGLLGTVHLFNDFKLLERENTTKSQ